MSTCIQCGKPTNLPTVTEIASNWELFCQYVNPDGAMSHEDWDALFVEDLEYIIQWGARPIEALEDLIREVWPECEDRCTCGEVPTSQEN